jgi:hypothetical protein
MSIQSSASTDNPAWRKRIELLYPQLEGKLAELGVTIWNNYPPGGRSDRHAFVGHYGEIPVIVEKVYWPSREWFPYIVVRYMESRKALMVVAMRNGFDEGVAVNMHLLVPEEHI